mmetsp:Transcript_23360/g.69080  ORF Transcript_23360/g.69080 Transcript_23360/m.69080 type:complete len:204 (+) Transcript_23360:1176-1787(+)
MPPSWRPRGAPRRSRKCRAWFKRRRGAATAWRTAVAGPPRRSKREPPWPRADAARNSGKCRRVPFPMRATTSTPLTTMPTRAAARWEAPPPVPASTSTRGWSPPSRPVLWTLWTVASSWPGGRASRPWRGPTLTRLVARSPPRAATSRLSHWRGPRPRGGTRPPPRDAVLGSRRGRKIRPGQRDGRRGRETLPPHTEPPLGGI